MKPAVAIAVLLALSAVAFGQSPVTDQPASKEDVVQMFHEMRFEEQMKGIQQNIAQQFQTMAKEMMDRPEFKNLPPDRQKKYEDFLTAEMQNSMNIYPITEIISDFAPVYAKYLSKSDVQGVIAFYHSPAGKKMLDVSPSVSQEAMTIIAPKIQDRMMKAMEDMQKRMRDLLNEAGNPGNLPQQNQN